MQVRAEEFASHIAGPLAPVYLISGDETLLVEECCDQLIQAARQQGYTERSIHHVETGFRWHNLHHDAASLSLFAERKLLDVRVPVKKFDREASEALREWTASAAAQGDVILLLRTARLDPRQRSSAWFKALDQAGVVTLVWPVSPGQLPRWLKTRSQGLGITLAPDALTYLAERVEGNLLAAAQELDKLALLDLPEPITLEALVAALEDASRYNTFDLLDAVMVADAAQTAKIIASVREEGVSPFSVLYALASQLRRTSTRGLPRDRQRALEAFMRRIKDPGAVLAECAVIDQQGKGQLPGDAWLSLENLLLRLAGMRVLPLPSEDQKALR